MISAVILTKNEEENISECINSLRFCGEILVIDDNSHDKTRKIAKSLGANVVVRNLDRNYSDQCNYAVNRAKYDWVLFVDADERIVEALSEEISQVITQDEYKVYSFRRIDYIWGKWLKHGEVGAFESIRLVKKGVGRWVRRVHQFFETSESVGKFINPITHFPHKNLRNFLVSIDRWSSWHAIANSEEGKRSTLFKIVFYPVGHFVRNYIIRLGLLDGMQGLVFALMMSGHSYLSWSKQWLNQRVSTKSRESF